MPLKLKETNISNEHNRLKNPNWREADQLAIYKHDRGVEQLLRPMIGFILTKFQNFDFWVDFQLCSILTGSDSEILSWSIRSKVLACLSFTARISLPSGSVFSKIVRCFSRNNFFISVRHMEIPGCSHVDIRRPSGLYFNALTLFTTVLSGTVWPATSWQGQDCTRVVNYAF